MKIYLNTLGINGCKRLSHVGNMLPPVKFLRISHKKGGLLIYLHIHSQIPYSIELPKFVFLITMKVWFY